MQLKMSTRCTLLQPGGGGWQAEANQSAQVAMLSGVCAPSKKYDTRGGGMSTAWLLPASVPSLRVGSSASTTWCTICRAAGRSGPHEW